MLGGNFHFSGEVSSFVEEINEMVWKDLKTLWWRHGQRRPANVENLRRCNGVKHHSFLVATIFTRPPHKTQTTNVVWLQMMLITRPDVYSIMPFTITPAHYEDSFQMQESDDSEFFSNKAKVVSWRDESPLLEARPNAFHCT